ncbi:MAG: ATP-binding protein [Treponema sp.]|nr:ATP-binding protein [Treponema sp.]
MNIRNKILIPMVALTIGCCIIVLVSSILLYNRELNDAIYNKINVAAMVAENEIDNLKANAHIAALGIAINPDLIEAMSFNDREKILSTSRALQVLAKIDYCTILDYDGTVLIRTHEPYIYGDSLVHLPHVEQALRGNSESYVAQGVTVRLGAYAGAPIYDADNNLLGVVSLGYRLDDPEFTHRIKRLTECDIGVFLNDERIATTLLNDDGSYALGTKAPEEISNIVLSGEQYVGEMQLLDKNAIAVFLPVFGAYDEVVGMLSKAYFTIEETNKIWFFIVSGILITLVVLTACILIARFISKVVERQLEGMMKEIQDADEIAHKAITEKNTLANIGNIMNGLDTMIYVTDPATSEILFMNNTMKEHYGIEGDCVGKLCYKVLQKDLDKRCDFCPCYQLDNDPEKAVVWEEHSSLTNHIYRNTDRYISWSNNKTVHIQHSVDMTELIAAKDFAEHSSRYKSAFLAIMSHEIRTPMNAILGIAEIQLRDEVLSADTEEAFQKIYESGDLLLNIINDILDLSKIEAGKLELAPIKYDIPSLVNDTAQLIRLRYESKPIELFIDVDKKTPIELFGDELRIKQVLNNILSNAFKYTNEGNVKFSVYSENIDDDDLTIVFRISDTGQGMTAEQVEKLFDEYTRFNIEANRTTVGTGLGMSITQRLVNLMNGRITVESEVGKGSVFSVYIPQKRIGTAVCGAELSENLRKFNFQSTAITKKTQFLREYMPYGSVLIVDDVESNIYVAKGMLAPYGLKIDAVTSGYEAIDFVKSGNVYDIIFMDHMMPKMDGIEAVKIIREFGYKNNIIALTANALIGREEMFLQHGFDAFISKPIDSRQLNLILNEYIRNKKPKEVVDAARSEQRERKQKDDGQGKVSSVDIIKSFVRDAASAISVLEGLNAKIDKLTDDEIYIYIITVHGIKSALANVGERKLSEIAFKLELAGKDRNFALLTDKTHSFIDSLKSLVIKYKPEGEGMDVTLTSEDLAYLSEKLANIKSSCDVLDKQSAKAALKDIKQKVWPHHIDTALDHIAVHLLHSEFDEAASMAVKTAEFNE